MSHTACDAKAGVPERVQAASPQSATSRRLRKMLDLAGQNTMIERDIDITCIARRLASPPKLDTLWWWQWDDTWNLMIGDVEGSAVSVDTSLYKFRCGCGLR